MFIFSFGVMQHVHPDDFEEYFDNIDRLMQPETRCIVRFKAAQNLTPCSRRSWAHSATGVSDALRRRRMQETVLTELPHRRSGDLGVEITTKTIVITRV